MLAASFLKRIYIEKGLEKNGIWELLIKSNKIVYKKPYYRTKRWYCFLFDCGKSRIIPQFSAKINFEAMSQKLEQYTCCWSNLEWFENNYIQVNGNKTHPFLSTWEILLINIEHDDIFTNTSRWLWDEYWKSLSIKFVSCFGEHLPKFRHEHSTKKHLFHFAYPEYKSQSTATISKRFR